MAKEEKTELPVTPVLPEKKYEIVGLKQADYMPIELAGQMYNLANLSDVQLETLLAAKCPFVVKKK